MPLTGLDILKFKMSRSPNKHIGFDYKGTRNPPLKALYRHQRSLHDIITAQSEKGSGGVKAAQEKYDEIQLHCDNNIALFVQFFFAGKDLRGFKYVTEILDKIDLKTLLTKSREEIK